MKKILFLFCLISTSLLGQIQDNSIPASGSSDYYRNEKIPTLHYLLKKSDFKKNTDSCRALGTSEQVNLNFFDFALKSNVDSDVDVYRLNIEVENAYGIGISFDQFVLPKKGKFYVYNKEKDKIHGGFTSKNNRNHKKFAIGPIDGNFITLEYNIPNNSQDDVYIEIDGIDKFFEPISKTIEEEMSKSTPCYIPVHCKLDIEVERSVLMWLYKDITDGQIYYCSGALIGQAIGTNGLKPYVITANHCGENAQLSTAKFFFNYQKDSCGSSNGTYDTYTTRGASKVASEPLYDMFLLELDDFPPPEYNVHLSGWERSSYSNLPSDMMGIHHPGHGQKSLSLGTLQSNTRLNYWRVIWDLNDSPTTSGSSGSPLFEENNDRIIGWLSAGASSCTNLDGIDLYGKLRKAWDGSSSSTRLKDWLDPYNYDNMYISGKDPCFSFLVIEDCNLYRGAAYQPENTVVIQASSTIETSGNVYVWWYADYVFKAGSSITLNKGFSVESTGQFTAKIQPCTSIAQ